MKYKSVTYFNKNGQKHRTDGPAYIDEIGSKIWYINGKYHRENGPAVYFVNDRKVWYKHGERHREDGPACIDEVGFKDWWVNGELYGESHKPPEEYLNALKDLGIPFVRGSDDPKDYPE